MNRIVALAYGRLSYLVFLASFLYAIGFTVPHATGLFLTWTKVKMNDDGQAAANLPTVGGTK